MVVGQWSLLLTVASCSLDIKQWVGEKKNQLKRRKADKSSINFSPLLGFATS